MVTLRAARQTRAHKLAMLACNNTQIALHMRDGPPRKLTCTALHHMHACVLHCMHARALAWWLQLYFHPLIPDRFLSPSILSSVLFSVIPHLAVSSRMEWHVCVIKIRST